MQPTRFASDGTMSNMRFLRGNLSCWALSHQALILFIIAASTLAGIYAFFHVGRAEDPPFAFKQMTIRTDWPGATARCGCSKRTSICPSILLMVQG